MQGLGGRVVGLEADQILPSLVLPDHALRPRLAFWRIQIASRLDLADGFVKEAFRPSSAVLARSPARKGLCSP